MSAASLIWQGYQIRSYTPFTLRLMVIGLFSSSSFATDTTFENSLAAGLKRQAFRYLQKSTTFNLRRMKIAA
jgi:hypothetical protein